MRAIVFCFALAAVGCSSSDAKTVCDPGKTESCACIGGLTSGVQTCEKSGTAWGKCTCAGDADAGTPPGGSGGAAAGHCSPGTSESCTCSDTCELHGKRLCDTEGNWSACDSATCQEWRSSAPECFP
jgi:hypothetical protein